MLKRFQAFLTPPTFSDGELTLTARLLYTLLGMIVVVSLGLTFPLALMVPVGGVSIATQGAVGILICVLLFFVVRRGGVRPVAHLLVWAFWVLNTITIITSGGIHSNAFGNYMVIIFAAGLLVGVGTGGGMTVLCALIGLSVVMAEQRGILPASLVEQTSFTLLFSHIILFLLVVILQGVAARMIRQALRRAEKSEAEYRSLLENVPAITYIASLEPGNPITYLSPQIQTLLGYSQGDFFEDQFLWLKLIHPDDRARIEAENKRANETGEPFMTDYRVLTKDGNIVWLHDEAVLIRDEHGKVQYWLGVWTDITARKQIEAALTQERDLLQALMNHTPDMIYFKDTASRFVRINITHAHFLGADAPDQAIGKTDLDFHIPHLAQTFLTEEQEMMQTGIPILDHLEFTPTPAGEPRWISATKAPIRDRENNITGMVGISRNVTERELTRQMLLKQANQLATVAKVSTAVSTILDPDELLQTIVDVTQENFGFYHVHVYLLSEDRYFLVVKAGTGDAGQQMQREKWQIPLQHPHSIVAHVARSWQGAIVNDVDASPEFLRNPLLTQTRSELTLPMIVGDQFLGVFDLQSDRLNRFNEEDMQIFTILAQQSAVALQNARRYELAQAEIIERKRVEASLRETENLFRAAIEAADAVPYSLDYGKETYTFMGEGIHKLIGFTPEEMNSQIWDRLVREKIILGEGVGLASEEAILEARRGGLKIWRADYQIMTKDNQLKWLSDASVQIIGDNDLPMGSIGILQDITERKQVEEALQQLNTELEARVQERTAQFEAANQELEAFSYTVSHDLRAPVRAMAGFSAILLEEYAHLIPLEAQQHLQFVRMGAERMGQLVDGLLTFTRLGRQTIVRLPVEMEALAHQAFNELIEKQLGRKAVISIGKLPTCQGDPALLRQVFSILLENALKYTQSEPEAQITVEAFEQGHETIYFVEDNGIGFDMQYAHKLFGVFQQLHLPGEYEGTGIGLALAKRIIEKHGGRIWAEAHPGQGAKFLFTIPPS